MPRKFGGGSFSNIEDIRPADEYYALQQNIVSKYKMESTKGNRVDSNLKEKSIDKCTEDNKEVSLSFTVELGLAQWAQDHLSALGFKTRFQFVGYLFLKYALENCDDPVVLSHIKRETIWFCLEHKLNIGNEDLDF